MAHYALLDENNVVVEVIAGKSESNFDWEQQYAAMRGMACKRTSYNTHGGIYYDPETGEASKDQSKAFRKNYAGAGYTYDSQLDAFIPPKKFDSWKLNSDSCQWVPPVPMPQDGARYFWDEAAQAWVKSANQ